MAEKPGLSSKGVYGAMVIEELARADGSIKKGQKRLTRIMQIKIGIVFEQPVGFLTFILS